MIQRFCAHLRFRNLSATTLRRRRGCIQRFEAFIAPTPLEAATSDDIEQFLATKTAPQTRHAYRSDLRVFYRWLTDKDIITVSPAAKVASIKVPKCLPRPIPTGDALGALTFGSRHVRRMVALALYAGLRCHEIAQLQAEDVYLHTDPPLVVVRRGKGAKDRSIPMHPILAGLLADLPSSGPVFPGRSGPTIQPQTVSRAIGEHLARCGIDATPHQLRHSFGTELARKSGGNLVLVAEWMGHESATTTMGYVKLALPHGAEIVAGMFGNDAA